MTQPVAAWLSVVVAVLACVACGGRDRGQATAIAAASATPVPFERIGTPSELVILLDTGMPTSHDAAEPVWRIALAVDGHASYQAGTAVGPGRGADAPWVSTASPVVHGYVWRPGGGSIERAVVPADLARRLVARVSSIPNLARVGYCTTRYAPVSHALHTGATPRPPTPTYVVAWKGHVSGYLNCDDGARGIVDDILDLQRQLHIPPST